MAPGGGKQERGVIFLASGREGKRKPEKAAPLEKESKKGVQLPLLDKGIWKFTGVTKIYDMKDFDKVSEMMEHHTDGFIKAAIRC